MILAILFSLLIVVCVVLAEMLIKASKRLLQFDEIFSNCVDILTDYHNDLSQIVKSDMTGLLASSNEVASLHKRNMQAIVELDYIVSDITKITPRKEKQKLPVPVVE